MVDSELTRNSECTYCTLFASRCIGPVVSGTNDSEPLTSCPPSAMSSYSRPLCSKACTEALVFVAAPVSALVLSALFILMYQNWYEAGAVAPEVVVTGG